MHIAKFKKSAVGNIFNHIERDGSRNHSNTNIDKAKTCLNYSLLNDGKTAQKRYAEILQRDNLKVANKDDLNTIISACITLPQSITDEEQSKAFFKAVFQAHCEKFGKENGQELLMPFFQGGSCEWVQYEDELMVTEPEALISYILSCHGNQNQYILDRYNAFRTFVKKKTDKGFKITKDAGIFVIHK